MPSPNKVPQNCHSGICCPFKTLGPVRWLFFVLLLTIPLHLSQGQYHQTRNVINHNNCADFVSIHGSTNVNEFSFLQLLNERESPIRFHTQEGYITIQIPAHNFEAPIL
ncbi:hypothetical protein [Geofilum rubicundum]|uniref:hypothetical protein n=1 Tax=Geofilum rubicundum TaxID=472113 RepID=UPI0012FB9FF4|nr:hypothetical protein [Geofilum rubicundum]